MGGVIEHVIPHLQSLMEVQQGVQCMILLLMSLSFKHVPVFYSVGKATYCPLFLSLVFRLVGEL